MTIMPGQVRRARNLLGWSQSDLAGHVGVNRPRRGVVSRPSAGRPAQTSLSWQSLRSAN
jgi:transcriptional regulator with XRE-family HTH domain